MKKILRSSIFRAICAIITGVLLVNNPDSTVVGITIAIGVMFLISGVISCATYLNARKNAKDTEVYDAQGRLIMSSRPPLPIVGIGSILLGLILAVMPGAFVTSLMYVLGALIILGAVNQFMAYAKRSKQPLERVDLGATVYETIDDMRLRTKDDVRIETSIMGNLFVMAHPTELTRAVQNLLVNADRYGRSQESGLLELNIQVLSQGGDAVLRISDKGVGVPAEEMQRIVRPFERGDTARGGAKGAGLGLAIVVRVVKRSGGRIKLSSNHPHGLIVELVMPLANKRNEKPVLEEQTAPTDTLLPRKE